MKNLKNKAKAYFLDMDGTFLDKPQGHQTVSERNVRAAIEVNKIKPVIFSTGRGNTEYTMDLARRVGSKYVVCLNGALIVDINNNELYREIMDIKFVREVLKIFKEKKMYIYLNGIKHLYTDGNVDNQYMKTWALKNPRLSYADLDKIDVVSKILVFGLSVEETRELWEELKIKYPELAFYLVSNGTTIEVGPIDANKGKANSKVCEFLGIDPKDAFHIGDSANDMPVVGYLGKFICMAGSLDFVKEVADIVGPDYANAGLSKILEELEDINLD
ncbi:COF family HAD hydrolase [Mycoplasmopsis californica]|uniref:COF family HAD hydrolase n=1 Tax=Mycoplasmopsis californica TaxID=2113 RepID=A0A059XV82_9BACT|nr:HAD-IIB family hydrolase [Mycoplasmopsis californica]AIA29231.1 COF family HAD hydrolase [Mycoplasmopsis californica]